MIPSINPHHEAVRHAQQRFEHLRLGRSLSPYHELLPAVLGQRVTALEALTQWRRLVETYGHPAPGPIESLRLPPDPDTLAHVPYFELHHFGIEKKRADTIRRVASESAFLLSHQFTDMNTSDATASLRRIHGVGEWTAAVAGGLAFGDPDALQIGDYHVKNTAAWALTGKIRGTDEEMVAEMLPYLGQRHRVMRWLELAGWRAPARGARQRIVSIARF